MAAIAGMGVLTSGLILGVPLTPLLAVWVALFDLVPQIGGAAGGARNVISGNRQEGIFLAANCASNHIVGNQIGTRVGG